MFYVLASLEVIAEEIENPFGTDANDLPLDTICKTIHKTMTQSFDHLLTPGPAEPTDAPKTSSIYDQ